MAHMYKCSDYLPYPRIGDVKKNEKYAQLLLDDYAGRDSELTAITQYIYQHFTMDDINREIANTTMSIAKVEMKHLELLGEAIVKLGGCPVFRGGYENKDEYWNGRNPVYSVNPIEVLRANIHAEKTAIENYSKRVAMIDEPDIQNLLKRIIRDEQVHYMIYSNLLKRINNKSGKKR